MIVPKYMVQVEFNYCTKRNAEKLNNELLYIANAASDAEVSVPEEPRLVRRTPLTDEYIGGGNPCLTATYGSLGEARVVEQNIIKHIRRKRGQTVPLDA